MSTLKVDTIQKADGTGSLSVPAESGTVVTTASPSLGRRNLIINGAMQVAQRGTSFTPLGTNLYSIDRWRSEGYTYDVDVTRQAFTSGQTDVDGFPTNYITVALNQTITTGQYWGFVQRIEKPQMILEGAQTFTLSFWMRATTGTISAGTFEYGLKNTRTTNPELTTTWQKITYTFTHTVDSANGYETVYLPRFGAGVTALSVDIAEVQLEVGSVATPFEHRSYGEELALCQRYYQSYSNVYVNGSNYPSGTGEVLTPMFLKSDLRADPTVLNATTSSGTVGTFNVKFDRVQYLTCSGHTTGGFAVGFDLDAEL